MLEAVSYTEAVFDDGRNLRLRRSVSTTLRQVAREFSVDFSLSQLLLAG